MGLQENYYFPLASPSDEGICVIINRKTKGETVLEDVRHCGAISHCGVSLPFRRDSWAGPPSKEGEGITLIEAFVLLARLCVLRCQ